jgi:pimeloyl-ACP methyl ester carboxylesterase
VPVALPSVEGVSHRTVDVGGLPVHVAEAGQGPPLVLLHGWPQHWWSWRRVIPLLAPAHRLVVPDLRGHGWTGAPATGYDKEQLATDLLGLLDALGLDRVQVVGHDWGGWTAFLACLRAPERFSSLLAVSIPHPFQRPDLRLLEAWRGAYQLPLAAPLLGSTLLRTAPAAVERLIRAGSRVPGTFSDADLRTYSAVLTEPARAHASSLLYRTFLLHEAPQVWAGRYRAADLRVPARLLAGQADLVASPGLLAGWDDVPDQRGLRLLPGVGHFLPEEAPQAVLEALVDLPAAG